MCSLFASSTEIDARPLATAQLILTSLSVCPADASTIPSKKRFHIGFTLIVGASQLCGFGTSLCYLIQFTLVDFEGSLFAFLAFIGHGILIYSLVTAFSFRHKIGDIFSELSTIYTASRSIAKQIFSSILFRNILLMFL